MGLFDKVKGDISSFDWNGTIGKESRTNQDNLPTEPGLQMKIKKVNLMDMIMVMIH